MARIISVTNQKGGVGKTTTARTLLSGLTKRGYSVLGIDMDPQWNLTLSLGADPNVEGTTELLNKTAAASDVIQHLASGIDCIAGSPDLAGADGRLTGVAAPFILKKALEPIRDSYDFIIIDTAPQLGILTTIAMTAADGLIIPAEAALFSLQGISGLADSINTITEYTNPFLVIDGVLLVKFNGRTVYGRDLARLISTLSEQLHSRVFDTKIRQSVVADEAHQMQMSLFDYAPSAPITQDYSNFIDEYLEVIKNA